MKKLFVILLSLSIGVSVVAQVKLGVKAGMNASRLIPAGTVLRGSSAISGYLFGGFVHYSLSRVFGLQTELVLSQQGADMVYTASSLNDAEVKKWREQTRLNYINLPVLLEIKPLKKVPVGLLVGLQIGHLVYSAYEGEKTDDANIRFNRTDVAMVLGAQYTIAEHLVAGIRYNMGSIEVLDSVTDYYMRYHNFPSGINEVFQLSVGWTF